MLTESRVIIIDDNQDLVENWTEILTFHGARVRSASDGAEGLALASEPFDIALVDMHLPDVIGTRLVPELRACDTDAEVLLITGRGSVENAVEAMRANAYDYLLKPISPDDLVARVDLAYRHVRSQREMSLLRDDVRRQNAFNTNLVNIAQVAILVLDTEGRIIRFNPYMEELSGRCSSEVVGQDGIDTLFPERDHSTLRSALHSTVGGTPVRGYIAPILARNGEERVVEWSASIVPDVAGALTGVLCVGVDITERRRAESELRHAQKMEAVGALASGVAHDFNNLLMGILGCTDLAMRQLKAGHEARRYLKEVRAAASNGATTVKQLLTFARKESDVPTASIVEPDSLLEGMKTLISRLTGEDVTVEVLRGAPRAAVRLEQGKLDQILMNLVVNARHAMPRGGRLSVQTSVVNLDQPDAADKAGLSPGPHLLLSVRDTGCGISAAVMERVFEPFFTTKGPEQGTGLGLSTVYGIVKRAHGYIELSSQIDVGTEFQIYFPIARRAASDEDAAAPLASLGGRETILVVEDERLVRMTLEHQLEAAGYSVLFAADGQEALELLRQHDGAVDAALTDVVLPGGRSGTDVGEEMRRLVPALRVIYMSAHPLDILVRQGRVQLGAALLEKPFTERALLERIRKALNRTPSAFPPPLAGRAPEEETSSLKESGTFQGTRAAQPQVLIVEDEAPARFAMTEVLRAGGYPVFEAKNGTLALDIFRSQTPRIEIVITDLGLPDIPGHDLVSRLRKIAPGTAVIYVTGSSADELEAERAVGAAPTKLLTKPVDLAEIEEAVSELAALIRLPAALAAETG